MALKPPVELPSPMVRNAASNPKKRAASSPVLNASTNKTGGVTPTIPYYIANESNCINAAGTTGKKKSKKY